MEYSVSWDSVKGEVIYRFDTSIPSQNKADSWIYAYSKNYKTPSSNKVGKWLLFFNSDDEINEAWLKIKKSTEEANLGLASKTSTIRTLDKYGTYVICVYTYNYTDIEDMFEVFDGLLEIGFKAPIPYKRDIDIACKKYGDDSEFYLYGLR